MSSPNQQWRRPTDSRRQHSQKGIRRPRGNRPGLVIQDPHVGISEPAYEERAVAVPCDCPCLPFQSATRQTPPTYPDPLSASTLAPPLEWVRRTTFRRTDRPPPCAPHGCSATKTGRMKWMAGRRSSLLRVLTRGQSQFCSRRFPGNCSQPMSALHPNIQ